jgi:hypothetical protein
LQERDDRFKDKRYVMRKNGVNFLERK